MAGHGSRYLLLRERAIAALVLFGDTERAATSIGIPSRSFRGWMLRDDFMAAVQELRQQVKAGALVQITGMMNEAIESIRTEARNATKSADRIRAWRSLLEFEQRMSHEELRSRVDEMERQIAGLQSGRNGVTVNGSVITNVTVAPAAFTGFLADIQPITIEHQSSESQP